MKKASTQLLLALLLPVASMAQYCAPTFAFGCFNWRSLAISIGTINYTEGPDCTVSDFTNLSTTVFAGTSVPMSVESGVWCGAAVWVDFDQSMTFEDSENLYYSYVGNDPSHVYSFMIDIPANTPAGSYRMRVISPWGSDGFLDTNTNGYGPCGNYQYGNFTDLTLVVDVNTGIDGAQGMPMFSARPNPTTGDLTLDLRDPAQEIRHITVRSSDGRAVQQVAIDRGRDMVQLDLGGLDSGIYHIECISLGGSKMVKVMKE